MTSPFISVDDPPEQAPHVDPYEAAKQIRTLARQLVDQGDKSYAMDEIRQYLYSVQNYTQTENEWLDELRNVVSTRKTSLINGKIRSLQNTRDRTQQYVTYAMSVASNAGSSSDTSGVAEQISKLAQSLPTVPTAPVMPFDQTLRAIATLLKNAGYFSIDQKGQPTPINYSEASEDNDYDSDDEG